MELSVFCTVLLALSFAWAANTTASTRWNFRTIRGVALEGFLYAWTCASQYQRISVEDVSMSVFSMSAWIHSEVETIGPLTIVLPWHILPRIGTRRPWCWGPPWVASRKPNRPPLHWVLLSCTQYPDVDLRSGSVLGPWPDTSWCTMSGRRPVHIRNSTVKVEDKSRIHSQPELSRHIYQHRRDHGIWQIWHEIPDCVNYSKFSKFNN